MLFRKQNLIICCLLFITQLVVVGQQKPDPATMDAEDFLELCRDQLINNCWFKLEGKINSRTKSGRRGGSFPVKCAAQLIPNKITFQATIEKKQSFKVENIFGEKHDTKVLKNTLQENNSFERVGIKPTDLSLAFMYWDFQKEYEKENIGTLGALKCRVLLLGSPDGDEFVKVWFSQKYLSPAQVHWYKASGTPKRVNLKGDPDQILEFSELKEINKVWLPTEIKISNKKGELQVKFDKHEAAFSRTVPTDLYDTEN